MALLHNDLKSIDMHNNQIGIKKSFILHLQPYTSMQISSGKPRRDGRRDGRSRKKASPWSKNSHLPVGEFNQSSHSNMDLNLQKPLLLLCLIGLTSSCEVVR